MRHVGSVLSLRAVTPHLLITRGGKVVRSLREGKNQICMSTKKESKDSFSTLATAGHIDNQVRDSSRLQTTTNPNHKSVTIYNVYDVCKTLLHEQAQPWPSQNKSTYCGCQVTRTQTQDNNALHISICYYKNTKRAKDRLSSSEISKNKWEWISQDLHPSA
jgi:hypothetical protein